MEAVWKSFGGELDLWCGFEHEREQDIRLSPAARPTCATTEYLTHPIFHLNRAEAEITRYMRRLADRDLALDRAMIPLGSCTMKLNATIEMIPITWPEFANLHPFVPDDQALGYKEMIEDLNQETLSGHRL